MKKHLRSLLCLVCAFVLVSVQALPVGAEAADPDPDRDLAKNLGLSLDIALEDPEEPDPDWSYRYEGDQIIATCGQIEIWADYDALSGEAGLVSKVAIYGKDSGYHIYGMDVGDSWDKPGFCGMDDAGSSEYFDAYGNVLVMYDSQAEYNPHIELNRLADPPYDYSVCPRCGSDSYREYAVEKNSRVCRACGYVWY